MNYLIWGVTGQARVVRPILDATGASLRLLIDNNDDAVSPFSDIDSVLNGGDWASGFSKRYQLDGFVVAIGGTRGHDRLRISLALKNEGLLPLTAIHSSAWIANSAKIGEGCQVAARSCVSENVILGDYSIINTGSIVDHDCEIGNGVHIMPGATIAGEVTIEELATVGSNATILPRMRIGRGSIVGAGAVVTKDVPPNRTVVGVPARIFPHS